MARSERSAPREDVFARQGDFNEQLYMALKKSPWWAMSIAFHLMVFFIMQAFGSETVPMPAKKPLAAMAPSQEEEVPQDVPEVQEETEEVQSQEVVAKDPVIKDAPIDDHVETDNDMPFEESMGETEGLSDAPFEGPQSNNLLGTGGGAGGAFKGRGGMKNRTPGGGGRTKKDDAVLHALRWLAAHQSEDGGWEAAGFDKWCDGKPNTGEKPDGPGKAMYDAGVTGLALCAFLGAGYSNRGEHEFTKVVRKGLAYLKNVQDPEGCFGPRSTQHYIYNHATAALAMVEAYGMTESPIFKGSAQKALDFIALSRNPYFVWRYGVKPGDNDSSVTGWMMMALKSAKLINDDAQKRGKALPLVVDEEAFDGIKAWLDKMTDPDYGRVGYISRGQGPARPQELVDKFPNDKSESMTAVGMLARIFMHEDPKKSDIIKKGGDLCMKLLPTWNLTDGSIDMYYWYYATLAIFQMGGEYWSKWEKALDTSMVANQRMEGTYCAFKGSWDPVDPWGPDGGRVYSTAILCMCLEVIYRYDKVFGTK
jgi:hypothetical protein